MDETSSRNVKKCSPFVSEPSTGIPTSVGVTAGRSQQRLKPKLLSLPLLQGEVSLSCTGSVGLSLQVCTALEPEAEGQAERAAEVEMLVELRQL